MALILRLCLILSAIGASAADLSITRKVLGAPLTVRACGQFAGAICSVTWNGKEFVNRFDHGREFQSASSFDGLGECFNPTEGGSDEDGTAPTTTSVLESARRSGHALETVSRMAFWLHPGRAYPQGCGGRDEFKQTRNTTALSPHRLGKRVTIGYRGIANAIEYDATFNVAEPHASGVFEAVTGYMPPEFSHFRTFDPATGKLADFPASGQGEQSLPVVFSTADDRFAIGVYSPGLPQADFPHVGYGRFQFLGNPGLANWNTVKWNCVFRYRTVEARKYRFQCYMVVGSLEDVRASMVRLRTLAK